MNIIIIIACIFVFLYELFYFLNKTCDDFVVLVYVNYSDWESGVLTAALIIALIDSLQLSRESE